MTNKRIPEFPVNKLFIERRSLRALTGQPITHEELMPLFEAAKWAPSSGNAQPWRFLYAYRNTPLWETFFNLLEPSNQEWSARAGVLILILSRIHSKKHGRENKSRLFDTGAAWQSMVLQGSMNGLIVQGIGGFDASAARIQLNVPEGFDIVCMASVGKPGGDATLLSERWSEREQIPSPRSAINLFTAEGPFAESID